MLHGGSLAASLRRVDECHFRVLPEQVVRTVAGAVGDPHDAKFLARIVQLTDVLHLLADDVLLVVGTDHQRHLGQLVIVDDGLLFASHKKTFQGYERIKQQPVAQIGVEYDEQAEPETDLQCCHYASSLFSVSLKLYLLFHVDELSLHVVELILQERQFLRCYNLHAQAVLHLPAAFQTDDALIDVGGDIGVYV